MYHTVNWFDIANGMPGMASMVVVLGMSGDAKL